MKPFYWLVRNFTKCFLMVFYRHRVYGIEHIIKGRAILAPNHASFLDPPLVAASWPQEASFLARKSLFSIPIIGSAIRRLNSYPVAGTAQDLGSIKLICHLLEENSQVIIFPEGNRTFDGQFGPIKSGIGMLALRCHSPIVPIYIHGSFDAWNRTRKFPKLLGKTACVIGSPIDWQPFSHLDKKAAQEAIAIKVKESLESLKKWYENGAEGSPP